MQRASSIDSDRGSTGDPHADRFVKRSLGIPTFVAASQPWSSWRPRRSPGRSRAPRSTSFRPSLRVGRRCASRAPCRLRHVRRLTWSQWPVRRRCSPPTASGRRCSATRAATSGSTTPFPYRRPRAGTTSGFAAEGAILVSRPSSRCRSRLVRLGRVRPEPDWAGRRCGWSG